MKTFQIRGHGRETQACALWVGQHHPHRDLAVELMKVAGPSYEWRSVRLSLNPSVLGYYVEPGEFLFGGYSENVDVLGQLVALGLVETTGRTLWVGDKGYKPVCRLTTKAYEYLTPVSSKYLSLPAEEVVA